MESQNLNQGDAGTIISTQSQSSSGLLKFLIPALVIVSIGCGVVLYIKQQKNQVILVNPAVVQNYNQQGNLKTYFNENLGFEIKYPPSWVGGSEKAAGGNTFFLTKNDYKLLIYASNYDLIGEGIVSEQDANYYHFLENSIAGKQAWRRSMPYLLEGSADGVYRIDLSFPEINTGTASDAFKYRFSHYIKNGSLTYSFSYILPKGTTDKNYDKSILEEMDRILFSFAFKINPNADSNQKDSTSASLGYYGGRFYTFSYSPNWAVWEANPNLGLTVLYPVNKAEELGNKTLSMTDRITVSIINGQPNDMSGERLIFNGLIWIIKEYNRSFDGGTERGLEYYRIISPEKYLVVSSGISKKNVIEELLGNFRLNNQ